MTEREIFLAALDLQDPADRERFLEQACGGDARLRAAIDALFHSHQEAGGFLQNPLVQSPIPPGTSSAEASDQTVHLTKEQLARDAAEQESDDSQSLEFLSPSIKPGALGRLAHYEVLEVLGRGAFGTVLKAFDEKLHRMVAIKVMSNELASTSPARKRFLREARSSAAVRHENVVAIHAVEEQPLPYLVMEYIPGQTLQQALDGHGPLELPDILRLGQQIASGLAAAHSQGLIHRDIKPANILLEDGIQWKVKITDFGLARAADDASVTQSGMIAGTPMFMSPEQAHTNQIDQRSDLFSFGSVLYQMTSGRPPFRAPTTLAVLRRVTEETPHPIREIIPETPEWLCAFISRLHEKRPEDRYQTAREVADLLGRCQLELQLTGQVTCVPGAGSDIVTNGVGTEPVSQTESIPGNSATSPAAAPSVRRGVDGGAGARWKTARTALLSILTGLLIMSPILFGKRISNLVSPWIWGQIPTLPTVERAAGLRFDGKDDFIQIPMKWDTPLLTIEAFVTPDGFAAGGTVLQLTNERSAQAESIELFDEPSQAGKPQSFAGVAGGESHGTVAAPLSRAFRQHRAVTVDGSEMHYYVNGQWQGKRKVQPADQTQWKLRQLTIGCKEDRTNFFTGTIDQVRISKVIRYSSEFSPLTTLSSDDATLALYDFDGGTGDVLKESSGNGTDGKIFGATWVHPVQGLHFDGVDDYVDFENLAWTSNEYTFETWLTPLADHGTVFQTAIPEGHLHAYFYPGGSGTGLKRDKSYVSVNGPSQGTKRLHLATVFDGRNLSYFVNGKLAGSRTSVSELTTPWKFERMRLGTKLEPDAGKPEFFHGRIEQFRVSKSALYVLPFTPADRFTADAQTLALYNFDEGTGDVLKDISGHGHDGQIVGATWAKASVRPGPDGGTNTLPGGHKQEGSDPALTDSGWHRWPADAPKPAIAPFDAGQAKKHQEEWAAYLNVPVEFTNSIGMKLRLIPPGEFTMGSTAEDIAAAIKDVSSDDKQWQECIKSEAPQHNVILTQPIYLGVNELTQAEYEKVMGSNPSHFAPMGTGKKAVVGLETAEHPVEMVSWYDGADFCAKLSTQEKLKPFEFLAGEAITTPDGTGYRLPSEAEWEFACRAGTATKYWVGDKQEGLVRAAWFVGNARERTHIAGELTANPFGLSNMHGNVWEWVQDGWVATRYGQSPEKLAINPRHTESAQSRHVVRGGSFNYAASFCLSSSCRAYDPSVHFYDVGFRVSLPVDAVRQALKITGPAMPKRGATIPSAPVSTKSGWHGWPADAPKPAIAPFNAEQARKHQEEWAAYVKVPVEYTNSIGMKYRLIPPGEFMMGSTEEEVEPRLKVDPGNSLNDNFIQSELPRHRVILTQPVYFGVHEVTQENYEKLMEVNPSFHSPTGAGMEKATGQVTSTYPVESVDWNDATRFCAKLSLMEQHRPFYSHSGDDVSMMKGTGYRLPTEAEWEFACRSGTTTRSWAGDRDLDLLAVGWFQENSEGRTHAVGELKPNPFGLYDLQGNVWEWLQDWWGPGYYAEFRETTAIDPAGPVSGEMRVLRGVEAKSLVAGCAASVRGGGSPSGTRNAHFGFRTALPIDAVRRALHATAP